MAQVVYILCHIHEFADVDREDDVKLIGVYGSDEDARSAQSRASLLIGFKSNLSGFQIHPYTLGEDHWREGFTTVYHD